VADIITRLGWGEVLGPDSPAPPGTPRLPFDPRLVAEALAAIIHTDATAARWQTSAITPNSNNPVIASSQDHLRIGVSIQLPAGLAAYIGPNSQVITASGRATSGYLLPAGGGFVFGPENTLDVWLVHSATGVQDIRVLELFRAR
jgi:hypothetical protein